MLSVFRRLVLSTLMVTLFLPHLPVFAAHAAAAQLRNGVIAGAARSSEGPVLPHLTVRLRSVETGRLAGETITAEDGQFIFTGLTPGSYVVELVSATGRVLGTSAPITLSTTAMTMTGLTVRAFALSVAKGGGAFLLSTWGVVTIAAIGAGVVGVVVATNRADASPAK